MKSFHVPRSRRSPVKSARSAAATVARWSRSIGPTISGGVGALSSSTFFALGAAPTRGEAPALKPDRCDAGPGRAPSFSEAPLELSLAGAGSGEGFSAGAAVASSSSIDPPEDGALGDGAEGFGDSPTTRWPAAATGRGASEGCLEGGGVARLVAAGAGVRAGVVPGSGRGDRYGAVEADVGSRAGGAPAPVRFGETATASGAMTSGTSWVGSGAAGASGSSGACSAGG